MMRRFFVVVLVLIAALGLVGTTVAAPGADNNRNYTADLSGDQEVPPRETQAWGKAMFHVNKDRTEIEYKLIVHKINNVVASHIHLGEPSVNGGVVVFLYGPEAPGGGRSEGMLAKGTITADDLINDLAGMTIGDLLAEIEAGNAYVNVHTNDGVDPTNTGPGDFPGGEIRGQIH